MAARVGSVEPVVDGWALDAVSGVVVDVKAVGLAKYRCIPPADAAAVGGPSPGKPRVESKARTALLQPRTPPGRCHNNND